MIKKILITAAALFSFTYISVGYSNSAPPLEANTLNSKVNTTGQWVSVIGNLPLANPTTGYDNGYIKSTIEFNKKQYVTGSDKAGGGFVYVYNGNDQNPAWTSVASFKGPVTAVTVYKNTLYAYIPKMFDYYHNLFFSYNGDDKNPHWTRISTTGLPDDEYIQQLIVVNNKMYSRSVDSVYVYDDKNKSWSSVSKDMHFGIQAMTVFHDKLYVAGFDSGRPIDDSSKVEVYVYNSNDDAPSWSSVGAGLPLYIKNSDGMYLTARANTLNVFNDTLFVGGHDAEDMAFVYAYNGNDEIPNWSNVSNGLPNQGVVGSLVMANNTLYALGGERNGASYPFDLFVYAYNSNNSAPYWTPVSKNGLPLFTAFGESYSSLAAFNNTLYISSNGCDGGGPCSQFLYSLH